MASAEQSFKKWIGLATIPPPKSPLDHLTSQKTLLQETLNAITSSPNTQAATTTGIIKAVISSRFGTLQNGRETWENDPIALTLSKEIRDLTILIALSSLCLHLVLVPKDDMSEKGMNGETILGNRDQGFQLNTFLLQVSEPLSGQHAVSDDFWPIAIIILAWAIVLNSKDEEDRFPSPGYAPMEQEFARRALREDAGLWIGLMDLLQGSLMNGSQGRNDPTEVELRDETTRRKVVKGGLCDKGFSLR